MAFQRLEPAGPRLLSAPANSLAARRFRLSQRLILISFGPLLSLRLLFRQDCWPCCRLALFRTKSKDRSLSMSENLLLAFAFWIDRCRLFAPASGLCFIIHTLLRFARLKFSAAFRKVNRRTFHCCVKFTVYSNNENTPLFTLSIHHDEIPASFVDLACFGLEIRRQMQ